MTHPIETAIETVVDSKLAPVPPIVVSGISWMGISLQDWAYIVTITYTSLLIIGWIWKAIRRRMDK